MKKTNQIPEELISMNEDLHTEFAVQELEQRLETDPLFIGGLLSGGAGGTVEVMGCVVRTESACVIEW